MRGDTRNTFVFFFLLIIGLGFCNERSVFASNIGIVHATVQLSVCGNGIREPGEQCDGGALNGAACTTFGYDSGALGCSFACEFDVSMCSTSATAVSSVIFSPAADRTYILTDGDDSLSIALPSHFFPSDLTAFLFSHNAADYGLSKPAPSGESSVGKIYNLVFVDENGSVVHTLNKSNTITLSYSALDLGSVDADTIAPYRSEDGSSVWTAIPGYSRDATARTVTFTASDYSVFAIFGLPIGTTTTSGGGGGGGGGSSGGGESIEKKLTPEEKKRIIRVADFNNDNTVDISDLSVMLYYYGEAGSKIKEYDLHRDNVIDILDVSILLYYWNAIS